MKITKTANSRKSVNNRIYSLFFLVFASIIAYWQWWFKWDIITYSDWSFHYVESMKEFMSSPYVWSNSSFGNVVLTSAFYPIRLLMGVCSYLFSFALVERLVFFFPYTILGPLGSFLLCRKIIKSDIGSIVASFVYIFNTYMIVANNGHNTLSTAYSFAPLIILYFMKTLMIVLPMF